MPQGHLAADAIPIGVHVRRERDAPAGRQHGRHGLGGARPLRRNRYSVRGHGSKYTEDVKRRRRAQASRKDATKRRRRYCLVPTSDSRWVPTVPLTASVSFLSRYVPTNWTAKGLKSTVRPSGAEVT